MTTITSRIEQITADTRKFVAEQTQAATNSRDLTWSIVAKVYALGLEAFKEQNATAFDDALRNHGLNPTKLGANPWLQIINVAVGEFYTNSENKKKWKPNASFSKYARALRFMQTHNVKAHAALAYIQADTVYVTDGPAKNRRHLYGMIAADKIKYPAEERNMTDKAAVERAVNNALGRIPVNNDTRKGRHFTRAFGYVENGEFVLLGQLPDSEKAAMLDASKAGAALIAKEAS